MARPSSPAISTFMTSAAGTPSARSRSPRVPNIGLVKDCVAIAPTPLRAWLQRWPVAKAFVVTATPKAPVAASRATIDQVMSRAPFSSS